MTLEMEILYEKALSRQEGHDAGLIESARLLVSKYGADPEQAAQDLNLSEEARQQFFDELKK